MYVHLLPAYGSDRPFQETPSDGSGGQPEFYSFFADHRMTGFFAYYQEAG